MQKRNEATRQKILEIIATDRTFELADYGGREVWLGKCIHCNGRLVISTAGDPISKATIEHIVPLNHGGTDELENLALACARCNNQKGVRHDPKPADDPKLQKIVEQLQKRRRKRWREVAQDEE